LVVMTTSHSNVESRIRRQKEATRSRSDSEKCLQKGNQKSIRSRISQNLKNSNHDALNSRFFLRMKYMENENFLGLVAVVITSLSVLRLDSCTQIKLNDLGKCEATLTLINGIVTMSIVVIGFGIAGLIILLNWGGCDLLSQGPYSNSEKLVELFDVHRRKSKCIRKWTIRMVSIIALSYILSFCLKPILWCEHRVIGIFASAFLLLASSAMVISYKCVAWLYYPRANCRCFNKEVVNNWKQRRKEFVSSDEDNFSVMHASSLQRRSLIGSSRGGWEKPKRVDQSRDGWEKPKRVDQNLPFKTQWGEECRLIRGMQEAKFYEDLHRTNLIYDTRDLPGAKPRIDVHDTMTQNPVRTPWLSLKSSENDRKKRSWRSHNKKKFRRSQKGVTNGSSLLPKRKRDTFNSPLGSHATATLDTSGLSSRKQSNNIKNYHSVYRSERVSCLYDDINLTESESDIWGKISEEEEGRTSQIKSQARFRGYKEENKLKAIPFKTPKDSLLDTKDGELKGQTDICYHHNHEGRLTKLPRSSIYHDNPDIPILNESQSDGKPILLNGVMRYSEENRPTNKHRNIDVKKRKSRMANKLPKTLKNPNDPSKCSLQILNAEARDNRHEKITTKTPAVRELQERGPFPGYGDVEVGNRNVIQNLRETHEEGSDLKAERRKNSTLLLKRSAATREPNTEKNYELLGNSQKDLEIIWSPGKAELQTDEESSLQVSKNTCLVSNSRTSFKSKELMMQLESVAETNKPCKSDGALTNILTSESYETLNEIDSTSSRQEMNPEREKIDEVPLVGSEPNLSGFVRSESNLEDTLVKVSPSHAVMPGVEVPVK